MIQQFWTVGIGSGKGQQSILNQQHLTMLDLNDACAKTEKITLGNSGIESDLFTNTRTVVDR